MTTIKQIKEQLADVTDSSDPILKELALDKRSGVQQEVKRCYRRIVEKEKEEYRLEQLLSYEKSLYEQGYCYIAGIDEVGRGPLAGPVVAAAVVLPHYLKITGLNDSKKIPKTKHNVIYHQIMEKALAVGIGIVDETVIDRINIYEATKLAMQEAVSKVQKIVEVDFLLLDAMELSIDFPQLSLIKGDEKSMSIAAASIVAKVTRDRLMSDYDKKYPGYGFASHAGYGTKQHLSAIKDKGIVSIHRKSFEPIKTMLK